MKTAYLNVLMNNLSELVSRAEISETSPCAKTFTLQSLIFKLTTTINLHFFFSTYNLQPAIAFSNLEQP